ncbi:hypothetical protein QYE76_014723 [Lolium multiflorum]|uniref:Cyclic nucleotide-binding domain-containing protein n=1 Tax=Lolium multiflorum TaxID=4521 RepID=A0AAD8X633_LOLMU|nr:hypothetical protein QYE76_014723 [Lolium multiflorum]
MSHHVVDLLSQGSVRSSKERQIYPFEDALRRESFEPDAVRTGLLKGADEFGFNDGLQLIVLLLMIGRKILIVREGDPVQRMLFIVRGHLHCSPELRNGATSCCTLGPGNFTGDELPSWCLRRPFAERLPTSSSKLVTMGSTEVFGLEAADVKYVTQHFRYTFTNDKVGRSARYYSPGWRTWAAVAVQLAWRRRSSGCIPLFSARPSPTRTKTSRPVA